MVLTAVFQKFPEGYSAFIEELPGANTQGLTIEEARENLIEATNMVLETNRMLAEQELKGQNFIKESITIPVWHHEKKISNKSYKNNSQGMQKWGSYIDVSFEDLVRKGDFDVSIMGQVLS